jgi:hypothetical protein
MATLDGFRASYEALDDVPDASVQRALDATAPKFSADSYSADDLDLVILAQVALDLAPSVNLSPAPYLAAFMRIVEGAAANKAAEMADAAALVPTYALRLGCDDGSAPLAPADAFSFRLPVDLALVGVCLSLATPSTDGDVVIALTLNGDALATVTVYDTYEEFSALAPASIVAGDRLGVSVTSTGDEAPDAAGLEVTLYGIQGAGSTFTESVAPEEP